MKKLIFIIFTFLSLIIVLYLKQSNASQVSTIAGTFAQLKMAVPTLSEQVTSTIAKKAATLFSFIPARLISKGVWTGLGWGFDVLKPQLETTKWAGEKIQIVGKSSLTTAGLATAGSSLWFIFSLVNQIKNFREVNKKIDTLKKEIASLEEKIETPTDAANPEEKTKKNSEKQLKQKKQELDELLKQSSFLQRSIRIINAIKLPGILALIAASQVSQSHGINYAGSWLEYIGQKLGHEWNIRIK